MPKQPLIGIASTILIILISLGFISLFSFPLFSGWICYFLLSIIPMQIVMGVTWGGKHPGFAASKKQPLKGILMTLFLCAVGVVVGGIYFAVPGGSVNPPAPMLMMCSIVSVVVMFWLAIMFGGWPFTSFIKSKVGVGAALMVACYVLNYILFRLFFDYGFMQGAPVYAPQLDPHGLFNAWDALVFYVTFSTVMFVMQSFDLWPLTKSPALIKQPVLGIIWSLLAFVIGGGAFYIGVFAMQMDPVEFMVKVPIPFIFGSIVVLIMLHGSLYGKMAQPLKGVLNNLTAIAIGVALSLTYGAIAPSVTGALKSGPPNYDFEIWLASALLAVTFPFLVQFADFFHFWPLHRAGAAQAPQAASEAVTN